MDRQIVPVLSRNISFRAQPTITHCLIEAAYDAQLRAGVEAEDSMLISPGVQSPVQSFPIVLLCGDSLDFSGLLLWHNLS